jgi:RHS repeat-associated protein
LTDALGSTIALADGSGSIQTEYTYEPFGSVTTSGSANGNTFGFTGRENDGTGLNYYRARYYDPELHRFTAEDPIRQSGGLNLHRYANNAPTFFTDPMGWKPPEGFGPEGPTGPVAMDKAMVAEAPAAQVMERGAAELQLWVASRETLTSPGRAPIGTFLTVGGESQEPQSAWRAREPLLARSALTPSCRRMCNTGSGDSLSEARYRVWVIVALRSPSVGR